MEQISRKQAGALAQDYVVVARVPAAGLQATDPALIRLPGGRLLASWVFRDQGGPGDLGWDAEPSERLRFARSDDNGQTWDELSPLSINTGIPFICREQLYVLADGHSRRNLMILTSKDEGETWSEPVVLFEGSFWNTPSGTAIRNGTLYLAYGAPNREGEYNRRGSRLVAVAGNLTRDLLRPTSWRISSYLTYPGTPTAMRSEFSDHPDHWLEPNVVNVGGELRLLARVRIDHQATTNLAAICSIQDDMAGSPTLQFRQFYSVPGAQGNFFIVYDERSQLFWMTSNLASDSQNMEFGERLRARGFSEVSGGPGDERRFLMLSYSLDALNWFCAGCLAMTESPLRSFHYAAPLIDGEDLLFLSRTSVDAPNQHDSDLITFHQLRDFRTLALGSMRPAL